VGITNDGDSTEQELVSLVPNTYMMPKNSPLGDLKIIIDNQTHHIEVKKATLNQSRVYKYITIVAKDPRAEYWVVIPAYEAMKMAIGRKGQHSNNPFECMSLGKATAKKFEKFRCKPEELELRIKKAIEESNSPKFIKFANFAQEIRNDILILAENHQTKAKLLATL